MQNSGVLTFAADGDGTAMGWVIALVTGSAALLATLAASMGGLWLIATVRHAVASGSQSSSRHRVKTA